MSGGGTLPPITVSGGSGGIDARYDDIERLGRLYSDTGARLAEDAWQDKLEAGDGDLLASAPLSPATFAEAERAILDATYGPRGLVARAVSVEADSCCFLAVVEIYRTTDEAHRRAIEVLHYGLGYLAGASLPVLAVAAGGVYVGVRAVSPEAADELADDAGHIAMSLVEEHPGVVEGISNGGLLDGLAAWPGVGPALTALGVEPFHPTVGSAADDLGDLLFGAYHGEINDHYAGVHFQHPPPHDVADLVGSLADTAGSEVPDGVISVQRLTAADGSVSWVVQLPGTDDFLAEHVLRNQGSNFNLVAGDDTGYGEAVGLAMARAGVGTGQPVMLVGHSQGGMQAAALAADPDFGYHVTHVVTAGSPVALTDVPDDVTVLSLENTGDVVPLADSAANPPTAQHTTVQADILTGSLGAEDGQNHALSTYQQIAAAVDASDDPSLRDVISGMHAHGFLSSREEAVQSATWTFQCRQGEQIRPSGIARMGEELQEIW